MGRGDTGLLEMTHHQEEGPHLLRELVRTYQVLMTGFTREIGMPASRLALMRLLAASPDAEMGIMDLSRQLGINAAAVTRQLQEMEQALLIRRRADLQDRRRKYVSLTRKGRQLFAEIHERSHRLESALSSEIGAAEMSAASTVLSRLRAYLENLNRDHKTGDDP